MAAPWALGTGVLLACALVAWSGPRLVVDALAAGGWGALAAMTVAHLPSLGLCALAWQRLHPERSPWLLGWSRYIRDAVGGVVVVPVSGELAGARVLTLGGVGAAMAAAGTIVDVTAEMLSQAAFTLLGIALLAVRVGGGDPAGGGYPAGIALGATLLAALGMGAFVRVQRSGLPVWLHGLTQRLASAWGWPLAEGATGLGDALRDTYARRGAFARCTLLHLAAWVAGVLEVWVGLWMLGAPLSFADAVVLESQVFAVRAVAFVVPAGLGVQEGAYLLLGGLLGLPPSAALALSLLKRAREVLLGVPGLLAWQVLEGRRLLGTR